MKKILIIIWICLPFVAMAQSQYYLVNDAVHYPDPVNPNLEVYLVNGGGATVSYAGSIAGSYQWYQYNSDGSASIIDGATTNTLSNVDLDMGYYMMIDDVMNHYVWLVDYSRATFTSGLISPVSDDECAFVSLEFTANDLYYCALQDQGYSVIKLVRKYNAIYNSWDPVTGNVKEMNEEVYSNKIPAPLMNTSIAVYDVYADQLNLDVRITLDDYEAVQVYADIEEELDTAVVGANIQIESGAYAAPLRATFTAQVNPAANYYLWTVYKTDEDAENPIIRYTETDPANPLRYTFERAGRYKIELEVSTIGKRTQCKTVDEVTFHIVESFIDVPNAFSPNSSPGVNDEFRVAYKSITKFRAYIVNRWGQKLFEWNDPAIGWDGKFGGKYVPPGVYFYVIEWEGADGQKGVKKGDVNILHGRK